MIIQGSNKPIIIELDTDVSSAVDISVCLHGAKAHWKDAVIKRWGKAEIDIAGSVLTVPVKQSESMRFPSGDAFLLVKCTLDGVTEFFDEFPVTIRPWADDTILRE